MLRGEIVVAKLATLEHEVYEVWAISSSTAGSVRAIWRRRVARREGSDGGRCGGVGLLPQSGASDGVPDV